MKRLSSVAGLLLALLLLAGCWNYREMNELAFALAEGVDKIPGTNEYRMSFQIVNAQEIAGIKATGKTPVVVYTGTGNSLFEAVRNASQKVARRINSQHLRIFVIGEALAKESIEEILDLIERDPEPRMTTRVFIARNATAESILRTLTPLELIPANAILGKLKVSGKVLGESYETPVPDIIRGLMSKSGNPVISGIRLVGNKELGQSSDNMKQTVSSALLQVNGMALFRKGKLVDWASGDTARGISYINNKMRSTVEGLDCRDKKNAVSVELLRSKTNLKASFEGDRPVFRVHIHQIGNIEEVMCAVDLSKSAQIHAYEQDWSEETKRIVLAGIKKSKQLNTDVIGFGDAVKRSFPKTWKKMEKEWDAIFPTCKVEVEVDSTIRRTGIVSSPYKLKKE
ncbi:Ger(x)C family spore germination protein [Paenibacillus sp. FSL R10-2734]|uniref:Ger(x)C family spore germination protein n=1 Tax=Paenibacillus sp. FSL R10-2734 TaxID=2954691 RepID=UPI0030DB78F2